MSKPETQRKAEFEDFHNRNPQVWSQFARLTKAVIQRGHSKLFGRMIWELIRYNSMMQTDGDPFKLDNDLLPYYTRLFHIEYPQFGKVFETRGKENRLSKGTPSGSGLLNFIS